MDDLPFRGQTFLVATSEDLADKVARAVRERGGRAIPFPTIRLVPPADYENLDRGLRLWRTLDWVVFTSAHGVEADAYDAIPAAPDIDVLRKTDRIDVVLFTSASAATHLMDLLPKDVRDRLIKEAEAACIGPVTAEAARSLGFRVCAVARNHTVDGLVESVEEVRAHG